MNFMKFILVAISCSVLLFSKAQCQRDPREDTGPVRFPQNPPAPTETSGVRVGASGYGFVPRIAARQRSVVRAAGGNSVHGSNAG